MVENRLHVVVVTKVRSPPESQCLQLAGQRPQRTAIVNDGKGRTPVLREFLSNRPLRVDCRPSPLSKADI